MSTIIAFDFGLKRIGVAVGNTLLRQATPLAVIEAASNDETFPAIGTPVDAWQPSNLVVGLRVHTEGPHPSMLAAVPLFSQPAHWRATADSG